MNSYDKQLEMWAERRKLIADEYKQGVTMETIGRKWRISRERVRQIINKIKSLEREDENK